eukprot:1160643-Pelagomonas_calceolata.AAC.9
MGIWRVFGSTQLHNLAVRSILVVNSMPSGNKHYCVARWHHEIDYAQRYQKLLDQKAEQLKLLAEGLIPLGSHPLQQPVQQALAAL